MERPGGSGRTVALNAPRERAALQSHGHVHLGEVAGLDRSQVEIEEQVARSAPMRPEREPSAKDHQED